MTNLDAALTASLIEAIVAENEARYAANAAEPYVHADHQVHEERLDRLVAAVADGDDELEHRFGEALFDIHGSGIAWAKRVFAEIEADIIAGKCECDAYFHPSAIKGEYVHSESCPLY